MTPPKRRKSDSAIAADQGQGSPPAQSFKLAIPTSTSKYGAVASQRVKANVSKVLVRSNTFPSDTPSCGLGPAKVKQNGSQAGRSLRNRVVHFDDLPAPQVPGPAPVSRAEKKDSISHEAQTSRVVLSSEGQSFGDHVLSKPRSPPSTHLAGSGIDLAVPTKANVPDHATVNDTSPSEPTSPSPASEVPETQDHEESSVTLDLPPPTPGETLPPTSQPNSQIKDNHNSWQSQKVQGLFRSSSPLSEHCTGQEEVVSDSGAGSADESSGKAEDADNAKGPMHVQMQDQTSPCPVIHVTYGWRESVSQATTKVSVADPTPVVKKCRPLVNVDLMDDADPNDTCLPQPEDLGIQDTHYFSDDFGPQWPLKEAIEGQGVERSDQETVWSSSKRSHSEVSETGGNEGDEGNDDEIEAIRLRQISTVPRGANYSEGADETAGTTAVPGPAPMANSLESQTDSPAVKRAKYITHRGAVLTQGTLRPFRSPFPGRHATPRLHSSRTVVYPDRVRTTGTDAGETSTSEYQIKREVQVLEKTLRNLQEAERIVAGALIEKLATETTRWRDAGRRAVELLWQRTGHLNSVGMNTNEGFNEHDFWTDAGNFSNTTQWTDADHATFDEAEREGLITDDLPDVDELLEGTRVKHYGGRGGIQDPDFVDEDPAGAGDAGVAEEKPWTMGTMMERMGLEPSTFGWSPEDEEWVDD